MNFIPKPTNIKGRGLRSISGYITDDGEYFAYSVEWFFQRPADINFRDPDINEGQDDK